MENINVEKIMEGIRSTIPAQEEKWKTVSFSDINVDASADFLGGGSGSFDVAELEQSVKRATENNSVGYFHPLEGHAYTIPAKKIVRKLIRACVEPICRCVTVFENAVSRAVCQLLNFVHLQQAENKALRAEVSALRRQLRDMEQRLEKLEKAER
ncbi:MAG: hypothetical protein KBS46_06920 [Clostridiales bacterium]|nr:hypothetical protein [Candidatus Apopatocola equi]MCQ2439132.1 hypothetical protein [Oscillospiraceae bacterium]